jgi:hypothetical protein
MQVRVHASATRVAAKGQWLIQIQPHLYQNTSSASQNVDASLIGHSAPSLSHVRSKIATIVSIINRFMTFMTYALRDLSDTKFKKGGASSDRMINVV